jgi:hypothetical protein
VSTSYSSSNRVDLALLIVSLAVFFSKIVLQRIIFLTLVPLGLSDDVIALCALTNFRIQELVCIGAHTLLHTLITN